MAQPTPYTREFNFSNYQASSPSDPLPAAHVDAEYNRIKLVFDQILDKLEIIQNDDGSLRVGDATVGFDQLTADVVAAINEASPNYTLPDIIAVDYGVVSDYDENDPTASTDNTGRMQEIIDLAISTGRDIMMPDGPGVYFAQASASLDPGAGGFRIKGPPGGAVMVSHEGTALVPKALFKNTSNVLVKGRLAFENITFKGTLGQSGRETGSNFVGFLYLDHYEEILFDRCRWRNIYCMATDTHFNGRVIARGCDLENVAGDGIRGRDCFHMEVTGCRFRRMGDDAVAWHVSSYVAQDNYNPDDGSPRREGLIVANSVFTDCSACVTALGARGAIVQGNYANRLRGNFFAAFRSGGEGVMPMGHIVLTHNIILNSMHASSAIFIEPPAPRGTTETGDVVPGQPTVTTGVFIDIWDHQLADYTVAADAFPPGEHVIVSENIIARTLPAVTNYSDWGFGFAGNVAYEYDPAVTDDDLRIPGGINVPATRTHVRGNIVCHTDTAVYVVAQDNTAPRMVSTIVEGNTLFDFKDAGVAAGGTISGKYLDLMIANNIVNGDIYRQNSNSNTDGSYDAGSGQLPRAFSLGTALGASIHGNRVANVADIMVNPLNHTIYGNTAIVGIVGYGDTAGNKGIRNVPLIEDGFDYVFVDMDPTSATYGEPVSVMARRASAMPSSGFYLKGWFVINSNPSTGKSVLLGWKRITTGSGHTDQTDWQPVYADTTAKINGAKTYDPPSLLATTRDTTTLTVTGAAVGDYVDRLTFAQDMQGVNMFGYVSADNTVTVVFHNDTSSTIDLGNGVLRCVVSKA